MHSCTYTVMLACSFIHTHLFTHSYTHLLLHTLYTVMPTLAFTRVHMPHQTIPFMCLHTMHTRTLCRQEQSSAPSPGRGAPHPENLLSQQALPAGLRLRLHRKPSEQRQRHSVWRPLRALPFQSSPTAWWAHPYTSELATKWPVGAQAKSAGGNFPAFLSPDIERVCAS